MTWFSCGDYARVAGKRVYCCSSCHEDEDLGYEMVERYSSDDEPGTDDVLNVCCSASNQVDEAPIPWATLRLGDPTEEPTKEK